jgi:regulator of sigma E protease
MPNLLQLLLIYVLPFLFLITVVITVHELGHFWAARACGISIDRFSIGFGRALFSRQDKSGVEWRIGSIPLGGYVRFAGDSNDASLPDNAELEDLRKQIVERYGPEAVKRYYHFKPIWQRAIVAAAGPAANFLLAMVILWGLLIGYGEPLNVSRVDVVAPGSPAAAAGLLPGDIVEAYDGRPLRYTKDLTGYVMLRSNQEIALRIKRNGETMILKATPRREVIEDEITKTESRMGRLGLVFSHRPGDIYYQRYGPVEAVGRSVVMIGEQIAAASTYIGRIFTGKESGRELSGVIGMGQASGALAKAAADAEGGFWIKAGSVALNLIAFTASISVAIGFVNLMPIPILDGGHLAFYAYEAIARRPVSASFQAAGMRVGLALVLGLMLFATWNDLQRLRAFQFLGGLFS